MVCVLRFSRTFLRKNAHFQNMCAKKRNDFRQLKRSNFRVEKRRIYQSSWITWPIGLWLIWGIVLWKEINHVWSRVKNIAWQKPLFSQKNPLFSPKKTIVFQHVHFFIPLFWNEKLSLIAQNSWNLTVSARKHWINGFLKKICNQKAIVLMHIEIIIASICIIKSYNGGKLLVVLLSLNSNAMWSCI